MKILSRMIKMIVAFAFVFVCLGIFDKTEAWDYPDDFYTNEEYYYNLCTSATLNNEQYSTCSLFREYIEEKNASLEDLVKANEAKIEALKTNITETINQINIMQVKIDDLNKQITSTENSIKIIEEDIVVINKNIVEKIEHINLLDIQIKTRMVENQHNISTNSYIKFIMGASSFSDLLRRIRAINQMTSSDLAKIKQIEKERLELEDEKSKLEVQQANLAEHKKLLQNEKSAALKAQQQQENLLAIYHQKESELRDETEAWKKDIEALEELGNKIDKAMNDVVATTTFAHFVHTGFRISYGCYFYENFGALTGGFHAAIDCTAGYGSNVYAVGNGIVLATGTGCGWGYIGSTCNSGRGNYVIYCVKIGKHIYGIYNFHLSEVNCQAGDIVESGKTILGKVGSSGSSSGTHLHVMIIDAGEITLKEAVNAYKKSDTFGAGSRGWNYNATCPARNNVAPCVSNPMEIYNVQLRGYYNWSE